MEPSDGSTSSLTACGLTLAWLPAGPYRAAYTPRIPVAGFAFESQRGVHAFDSDRIRPFHAQANGLAFTPAGCSVYSEASEGGEYLTVSGDTARMASFLPDEDAELPELRFSGRPHPDGVNAACRLRRLLIAGEADPIAIECGASEFLATVGLCGGAVWRPPPRAASLTPRRLKIVEDLIEARLGEPLSVTEMAACCGLSAGFFLRAFKAATGQTPHRFLMERRMARARRLLAGSRATIGEIALDAGFAGQAHLTSAFRRHLGTTPAAYRRIFRVKYAAY